MTAARRARPTDIDEEHGMQVMTVQSRRSGGRRLRRAALGALAAVAALLVPAAAQAEPPDPEKFGLAAFETGRDGTSNAGGHPSVWTRITFKTGEVDMGLGPTPMPHGKPQRIEVEMPYGLVGNPQAMPTCARAQFYAGACPPQTQIGTADPVLPGTVVEDSQDRPIYNLETDGDSPALFGIDVLGLFGNYALLRIKVRPDGGLVAVTDPISRALPLIENTLRFWGVPYDENFCNPNRPGYDPMAPSPYSIFGLPCPVTNPASWERRAFMTSPTDCERIPTSRVRVYSYEGKSDTAVAQQPHAPEHCEGLRFEPEVQVRPLTKEAGAPAAVEVDIAIPQNDDPDGQATPHLRDVTMVMPEGLTINPGTARDLTSCSDAAFGKGQEGPAACPAGSKIGTIGITTPLLPNPIPGDIYLGDPKPGERFRLFLYGEGPGNVRIKISGTVQPDPRTGRVTAVFRDNPPLPFQLMRLRFRGGNHAVLAMPMTCGVKTGQATLTSYGGQSVERGTSIQVYANDQGDPCPEQQPFKPTFTAGTTSGQAGADTGLAIQFARRDQDQSLGGLKLELPAGVLGRLADFVQCPVADAEANRCTDESLVGGVTVATGAGDALLHLPGKVYLIQPPKPGQIAGMAIVVRAVAGPYDLGTVVVKTGIRVNPDTSLSVETEPMPTMLEGINLRIRQVNVSIDRPGFMFNPTDCSPKRITGAVLSSTGAEVGVASPFAMRGCADLPFAPPMTMTATAPQGKGKLMGLKVTLGGLPGHANARQVQVVLPAGVGARLDGPLQSQCTQEQFAAESCPAVSKVGRAVARTPILPTPLEGDVHFVDNGQGGGLPKLGIRLKGLIQLDLMADVMVTPGGRLTTTFPAIPDAPISGFELTLDAGANAILTGPNACGKRLTAERHMIAHSGRTLADRIPVTVTGCPASGAKQKAKRGGTKQAERARGHGRS